MKIIEYLNLRHVSYREDYYFAMSDASKQTRLSGWIITRVHTPAEQVALGNVSDLYHAEDCRWDDIRKTDSDNVRAHYLSRYKKERSFLERMMDYEWLRNPIFVNGNNRRDNFDVLHRVTGNDLIDCLTARINDLYNPHHIVHTEIARGDALTSVNQRYPGGIRPYIKQRCWWYGREENRVKFLKQIRSSKRIRVSPVCYHCCLADRPGICHMLEYRRKTLAMKHAVYEYKCMSCNIWESKSTILERVGELSAF